MALQASDLASLGLSDIKAAGSHLTQDASQYTNDQSLELHWAMKTYHHAETYYNLISSVDPTILRLTKIDDDIYSHFREEFPDLKLDVIKEEDLKSEESKTKWRNFCKQYEQRIEDFNFGTLLRLDSSGDYSEGNTCLSYKAQFLAIEIARNREGLNNSIRFRKNTTESATS